MLILILKWFISAATILLASYLIPGVKISGLWSALILVLILGFLNATIKPLLILLTLPINILTLGLFTFVINALVVLLASTIVKGFEVGGFLNALLFSLFLVIAQAVFQLVFKNKN